MIAASSGGISDRSACSEGVRSDEASGSPEAGAAVGADAWGEAVPAVGRSGPVAGDVGIPGGHERDPSVDGGRFAESGGDCEAIGAVDGIGLGSELAPRRSAAGLPVESTVGTRAGTRAGIAGHESGDLSWTGGVVSLARGASCGPGRRERAGESTGDGDPGIGDGKGCREVGIVVGGDGSGFSGGHGGFSRGSAR